MLPIAVSYAKLSIVSVFFVYYFYAECCGQMKCFHLIPIYTAYLKMVV